MRIVVIGSGYVGLVTGACLAEMGHHVTCVEADARRLATLRRGDVPFFELGLTELLRRNVDADRLAFASTLDGVLADAEVAFVAVGTPSDDDGGADVGQVLTVADALARHMQGDLLVALKSTVPVGTASLVRDRIASGLASRGVQYNYDVVANPEFLKEGTAVADFMRPDRIVIGADSERAAAKMRALYAPFVLNGRPVLVMDTRSAEMTKYAANAMLASRISMINELARVAGAIGADVMAVRRGMGADPRIGMQYLYPGLGYGGSCLPKDVRALTRTAASVDVETPMLRAIDAVNYRQVEAAVTLLRRELGDLTDRRIAVWGLAFKANTDDLREAPAMRLCATLLGHDAKITGFDPQANDAAKAHFSDAPHFSIASDMYEAVDGADALVVATEWGVFRSPDYTRLRERMRRPLVVDGRHLYDAETLAEAGIEHRIIHQSVD